MPSFQNHPHPVAICFNLLWVAALVSYALHEGIYGNFNLKYLANWNWMLQCIYGGLMLISVASNVMERFVILGGLFLVNGVVWVNAVAITAAMAVNPHMIWAGADQNIAYIGIMVIKIVVTSYLPVLLTTIMAMSRRKMIRSTLKMATESVRPIFFVAFFISQAVAGPLCWILLHTVIFNSVHTYGLQTNYAIWILSVIAMSAIFNTCMWIGFMVQLTPPSAPIYSVAQPVPDVCVMNEGANQTNGNTISCVVVEGQNTSANERTPLILV